MSPKPRRCLIFDFDGVLVDSEPLHFESWQQSFEQLMGIRITGSHHLLVGLNQEQIYQLWAGKRFTNLTDDLRTALLDLKKRTFLTLAGGLQPMPGSIDLLRRAQADGWYTAVVSRGLRMRLHRTLNIIQMPSLFDIIIGNEDALDDHDHKVHARAAHAFGIDPRDCVVIEDSVSGIQDALACGIGHVIGFASSLDAETLKAAGAHEVVSHHNEVRLP
ncbi:MAG: HAD family phosphatase [Chloroflexi bacterium]|nr:HAD family phosphatase [Chloroflexota bacterium]MCC6894276.1 HAD family phosphatase [Anaerolineae bacterium]